MTGDRNPEGLRAASAGWREMGRQLDSMVQGLDHDVSGARSAYWRGPAADAFGADWARLRKAVDEALPVFELVAAELDTAADSAVALHSAGDGDRGTGADSANGSGGAVDALPGAFQAAYALTALTQVGAALGSAFGSGRDGARRQSRGHGRGGRSLARSAPPQPGSEAPRSADPFAPDGAAGPAPDGAPKGGLGVAGGTRGPARKTDDVDGPDDRAPAAESAQVSAQRSAHVSAASPEKPSAETFTPSPAQKGKPDTERHGAFG